jgi:hypothetical protein
LGLIVGLLDVGLGLIVGLLDVGLGLIVGLLDVGLGLIVGLRDVGLGLIVGLLDVGFESHAGWFVASLRVIQINSPREREREIFLIFSDCFQLAFDKLRPGSRAYAAS